MGVSVTLNKTSIYFSKPSSYIIESKSSSTNNFSYVTRYDDVDTEIEEKRNENVPNL